MIVFLNGQFVPEDQAVVSVFDRSFLYGDGLFEAIRVYKGGPFRWNQHLNRLSDGASFLGVRIPFTSDQLYQAALELIKCNNLPDAILRITLSRGRGKRGYSPRGADTPVLIMTLHPLPSTESQQSKPWSVITSTYRVALGDRLACYKTSSKLLNVMARAEADENGADEALILNTNNEIVEGTSSNFFWIRSNQVFTPPVSQGLLPGVTRGIVFELCGSLGIKSMQASARIEEIADAEGCFLTLTSFGIQEVNKINQDSIRRSELTIRLQSEYNHLVARETEYSKSVGKSSTFQRQGIQQS